MKKHFLYLATIFFLSGLCLLLMIFLSQQIRKSTKLPTQTNENKKAEFFVEKPLPSPAPTPTPATVNLVFAGDAMFDRHIRQNAEQQKNYDFIIEDLDPIFTTADLAIINLEGPVTDFESVSVNTIPGSSKNYVFTFSPDSVSMLTKHNIGLVNLANNHILNFGAKGLEQTYQYLDANQIGYFGNTGSNLDENKRVFYYLKNNFKIAFVSYNQFVVGGKQTTIEDIQRARSEADYVILYPHWGNEYQTTANQAVVDLAHEFMDLGVDLIIGSHPHVVQNTELYKNKTIYYSLGNFVFDQYFSPETQTGLIVKATLNLDSKEISFEEFTTLMSKNGKTTLMDRTKIQQNAPSI